LSDAAAGAAGGGRDLLLAQGACELASRVLLHIRTGTGSGYR